MSTTRTNPASGRAFRILPYPRSWPAEAEEMAQALAAGARRPTIEAGLSLLLRLGADFWTRQDLQPFIKRDATRAVAVVDWADLDLALEDQQVPASVGERAIVALAASIAEGIEVDLEWALGHLTPELMDAFIDAVLYAVGSTEDES